MPQFMDFAWTDDGDLDLGIPRVNEEGQVLYKHHDGTIDTNRGEDGREIRDLAYVRGRTTEKQIAMNRLKTDNPDWFHHTAMGANMSDLIGEPNTKETGNKGVGLIMEALTYEGFYHPSQISIRPIPISLEEILFVVTIMRNSGLPYKMPVIFNLEHGIMSEYVPQDENGAE